MHIFFKTTNMQLKKRLQPSTIGAHLDYKMDFEI